MFRRKKKNSGIKAFMAGELILLENVNDPVFSQKMMGDGIAIEPMNGDVFAPVDGEVTVVFPTLHAYGFKLNSGVEILLHLGLNTVELNGQGFESFVNVGEKVNQGDLIAKMDLQEVKNHNLPLTSMCIVTSGESIKIKDITGNVTKDNVVFEIDK